MYIVHTIIQSKGVRLYSTRFLWLDQYGSVHQRKPSKSVPCVYMTHEITGRRSTLESKLNQILTCSSCQDPIKHHKNLPSNLSNLSSEETTNLHRWLLGRPYPSPQGSHSKTHQLDPPTRYLLQQFVLFQELTSLAVQGSQCGAPWKHRKLPRASQQTKSRGKSSSTDYEFVAAIWISTTKNNTTFQAWKIVFQCVKLCVFYLWLRYPSANC